MKLGQVKDRDRRKSDGSDGSPDGTASSIDSPPDQKSAGGVKWADIETGIPPEQHGKWHQKMVKIY